MNSQQTAHILPMRASHGTSMSNLDKIVALYRDLTVSCFVGLAEVRESQSAEYDLPDSGRDGSVAGSAT